MIIHLNDQSLEKNYSLASKTAKGSLLIQKKKPTNKKLPWQKNKQKLCRRGNTCILCRFKTILHLQSVTDEKELPKYLIRGKEICHYILTHVCYWSLLRDTKFQVINLGIIQMNDVNCVLHITNDKWLGFNQYLSEIKKKPNDPMTNINTYHTQPK